MVARRKVPPVGYGEQVCLCGYRMKWFTADPPDTLEDAVIERPCPHGNGTFIQYCPKCGKKTGMVGVGATAATECECWQELDAVHTFP